MRRFVVMAVLATILAGCSPGDSSVDGGTPSASPPTGDVPGMQAPPGTPTETGPPIAEAAIDVELTLLGADPVVGAADPSFHRFVDAGPLVRDDGGVLHSYRHSLASGPGEVLIDHMTSTDEGATWTVEGTGLVQEQVVGEENISVFITEAMILDDGQWAIWISQFAGVDRPSSILRATGPGPEGPFTLDDAPALEPGPPGSWDGIAVGTPRIVRDGDRWTMYFTGREDRRRSSIGVATSDDGVTWRKYDDQATGDRRRNPSDPITIGEQDYRPGQLTGHDVVLRDGRVVLFYTGLDAGQEYAVAVSDDGVTFRPAASNPAFTTGDVAPDAGRVIGALSLLDEDGRLLALIGSGSSQGTRPYAATIDLDLGDG